MLEMSIYQEKLDRANLEIQRKKDIVAKSPMRQKFHLMPETGWINDPCGLVYFKGKYHFFYQYNPFDPFWGEMFWGHQVSDDMLHFENLPPALVPSEDYERYPKGGCFTGSAIVKDDKLYLIYTGSTVYEQVQCIAVSEDGVNFTKYEGNPVLHAPEGFKKADFRDPKVWEHNGKYYMVAGTKIGDRGRALVFRSEDLINWEFLNTLYESKGEWGHMFECPNFFPLEDKFVLIFGPMGTGERKAVYFVGDFDYEVGRFYPITNGEVDFGLHFYAPQHFLAPDGRNIIVGWSNNWHWMPIWHDFGATSKDGWTGFFNIPREVTLNDDLTLSFKPIRELEDMAETVCEKENVEIEDKLDLIDGYLYEIKATVDLEKTTAKSIKLALRAKGDHVTEIVYDLKKGMQSIDLAKSDGWSKGKAVAPLNLTGRKELTIDIVSDRSSIEAFANDYREDMSCNIYTIDEDENNSIIAENGKVFLSKLEVKKLNP